MLAELFYCSSNNVLLYIPGPLAQSPGTTMLSLIAVEILYPKMLWPTHPEGCKQVGMTMR